MAMVFFPDHLMQLTENSRRRHRQIGSDRRRNRRNPQLELPGSGLIRLNINVEVVAAILAAWIGFETEVVTLWTSHRRTASVGALPDDERTLASSSCWISMRSESASARSGLAAATPSSL